MSLLGTRAGLFADLALIISIVGFIILCLGVVYAKRGIFTQHFLMTRVAVLMTGIAFIWMGYITIRFFPLIFSNLSALPNVVRVFHIVIGAFTLVSGILLAFDRIIKKTRYPMRTVFTLWVLALLLGIIVYIMRYILPSSR
ncbi:MAG TPA: hypothetical protein VIO11_04335 [Candidatus Methanoperedens sp.]